MPRCSIIIPVYNRAALTRQCLDALLAHPPERVEVEVVVVDDGSTPETPALLAAYGDRIRMVRHATNTGFATACNDGAAASTGEYLVFLNNDTIPTAGWLDALVRHAEQHPPAAAVGSKLLFPDDTIQHAGVVIDQDRYPRHLYAGFPADHPAVNRSRRFQIVTAASVLLRRRCFEELGGFDTAYRNGFEDVDLCLRLGERGHEVHYCHEAVLYHLESVSERRHANDRANLRLYRARWAHRVQPDDLHYYREDGLLRVSHGEIYPVQMAISPLLAVVSGDERERQADRLLGTRSRQVFALLKETIRLTVALQEAELWRAVEERAAGRERPRPGPASPVATPAAENHTGISREVELHALLLDAHEQLARRDHEIEADISVLHEVLATRSARRTGTSGPGHPGQPGFRPSEYLRYRQLVRRVHESVRNALPSDATVIVLSGGDDDLVTVDGRTMWHFPQDETGVYAGYHPVDSTVAIAHLEALRARGGDYLLIPGTTLWWLEHYREFRQHLESRYPVAVHREGTCLVFALRGDPASPRPR